MPFLLWPPTQSRVPVTFQHAWALYLGALYLWVLTLSFHPQHRGLWVGELAVLSLYHMTCAQGSNPDFSLVQGKLRLAARQQ